MCAGAHTGVWLDRAGEVHQGKPPRYRCRLGSILPKMAAISLSTGNGRVLCSYPGNPCPNDMFCNFDHGEYIGGFCEHCHDESDGCDGYTCAAQPLASET